ncbi:MAG: thioredoxin family protein [Gammaproteobacteria bacterium]|nr:thioredoxin family protein [Gammaproteobacteria bacterium]
MAAVESQMLELGTEAPAFSLPDPDGTVHSLRDGAAAYLVMFICNHCPYVKHVRDELSRIGHDYGDRNVSIIAINSNDATTHPGDSPEMMKIEAQTWDYTFPYVYDADQSVAKAYFAACTPDIFVFDARKSLVYRGQLDDSRPGNNAAVDGKDLRAALDAVLAGEPVSDRQTPSLGCSIKWTPGNEPDYF